MILRPQIFDQFPHVIAAQSTRKGGVSKSPYDSMNLGSMTADDIFNIEENKRLFSNGIGFEKSQIVRSKQTHGTEILTAARGGNFEGYDALITDEVNLLLCVSTADCVPILVYDDKNKSVAAIHAGWKGTCANLVTKTIAKLKSEYNASAKQVFAYIGPSIGECSFEVDEDVAKSFEKEFVRYDEIKEKYFIDLKAHNKNQLLECGINEANIEVSPYDTYQRTDLFYSHRRENGLTGRMYTAIGLKYS
jgi:polyphenol oxidase